MRPTALLALLAVLLLPACELRLANDVVIDADGGGSFELRVALDDELHTLLVDAGLDPLLGIEQLETTAPDWTVDVPDAGDGSDGLSLSLSTTFDGPEDFARVTDGMHEVLDDADGRLWDSLRVSVVDGEVSFSGTAGLLVPRFPGADGVSFDEQDLATLVRERGDEFVRYELRVTLPGQVRTHDGDQLTGSTVVWRLPVGEMRPVSATSELAVAATPLVLVAVGLVVATAVAVSIYVVRVRRASRRRRAARSVDATTS